jgi:membrane protein DedA with SNARE-associated domain
LSGLGKIPFGTFVRYVVFGEFLYVVIFGGLGYVFGDQWESVSSISGDVSAILILTVSLIILLATLMRGRQEKG